MPVTLGEILTRTRQDLPAVQARRADLERAAGATRVPPPFAAALRRPNVSVIAEVKRRSPSAGPIREDLQPAERAVLYASHGAAALSVLTDGPYFGGSMEDLEAAASRCTVPVLRKDFILDEAQVLEARAAGASAVLLIVRALPASRLRQLLDFARELDLEALVEVHTAQELSTALESEARVIGVNSRDLDTFTIDAPAAWRLMRRIPADRIVVAESGMAGAADVVRAAEVGADAVLIGTALSRASSPERLLKELTKVPRRGR
jgi:indole-3-glycerol phosphate synthase